MLKQLSGLDASFLYLESPTSFLHVNSLSIYERPDDPDYHPFEAARRQVASRLEVLEPFRRRLVQVPFGLDHPYWIEDPDFDLDFHMRHIAVPPPGDADQIAALVARIIGRPMDRSRPLWEMYVLEGFDSGDFGVLTKFHHATIDGAAGAAFSSMLLDKEPLTVAENDDWQWEGDRVPSDVEMLNRSLLQLMRSPRKIVKFNGRLVRQMADYARSQGLNALAEQLSRGLPPSSPVRRALKGPDPDELDKPPALPLGQAPPTPFNASITPNRRFAYRSVPLADVKALKKQLGCTVNDVVMAVCAGALRRYLDAKDALPDENLIVGVPVSIRTGDEEDPWTNRVTMVFVPIPTTEADPHERLRQVSANMTEAKGSFELLPADLLVGVSDLIPNGLATRAVRLASRLHLADRVTMPFNLIISNVPGPREDLFMGGARLKHYYPVSTITDGQGLNITVQSYADTLDFGLVACRELVPDLWDLVDMCIDEFGILQEI